MKVTTINMFSTINRHKKMTSQTILEPCQKSLMVQKSFITDVCQYTKNVFEFESGIFAFLILSTYIF